MAAYGGHYLNVSTSSVAIWFEQFTLIVIYIMIWIESYHKRNYIWKYINCAEKRENVLYFCKVLLETVAPHHSTTINFQFGKSKEFTFVFRPLCFVSEHTLDNCVSFVRKVAVYFPHQPYDLWCGEWQLCVLHFGDLAAVLLVVKFVRTAFVCIILDQSAVRADVWISPHRCAIHWYVCSVSQWHHLFMFDFTIK